MGRIIIRNVLMEKTKTESLIEMEQRETNNMYDKIELYFEKDEVQQDFVEYLKDMAPFVAIKDYQDSEGYHSHFTIIIVNEKFETIFSKNVKSLTIKNKKDIAILDKVMLENMRNNFSDVLSGCKYYHGDVINLSERLKLDFLLEHKYSQKND